MGRTHAQLTQNWLKEIDVLFEIEKTPFHRDEWFYFFRIKVNPNAMGPKHNPNYHLLTYNSTTIQSFTTRDHRKRTSINGYFPQNNDTKNVSFSSYFDFSWGYYGNNPYGLRYLRYGDSREYNLEYYVDSTTLVVPVENYFLGITTTIVNDIKTMYTRIYCRQTKTVLFSIINSDDKLGVLPIVREKIPLKHGVSKYKGELHVVT